MIYPSGNAGGYSDNNRPNSTFSSETPNAEQIWQQFETTGRVADYLSYRNTLRKDTSDIEQSSIG